MTHWHYDATSETVFDADTGDAIARDVSRKHGALIAAAGEMREALAEARDMLDAHWVFIPSVEERASRAMQAMIGLLLVRTEPQP